MAWKGSIMAKRHLAWFKQMSKDLEIVSIK